MVCDSGQPRRADRGEARDVRHREVLDRGYWCAFTIYPGTKMGNERMVDILQVAGAERVIVDGIAGDAP